MIYLLIFSIVVTVMGIFFFVIGYLLNASYNRKSTSIEQLIDTEKNKWVGDFSEHLRKLFSAPCPTCATATIIAEGITEKVRTYDPANGGGFDYDLLTTRSYTRFCPNCEKLVDEPAPMTESKKQLIGQERAFKGSEPFRIVQIHQFVKPIVDQYAERNFSEHDRWGYQPGSKIIDYERLLANLNAKAGKYSGIYILGWVFVPIGLVGLFFWFALR